MRFGRLASAGMFAAFLSAPLFAQATTKKYDWAPINGVQEVDVRDGEVVVSQLIFNQGSTLKGTPIRKGLFFFRCVYYTFSIVFLKRTFNAWRRRAFNIREDSTMNLSRG